MTRAAAAEEAWPDLLDADFGVLDEDEDEEDVSPGDIVEDPENDLPANELQALYTAATIVE